MLRRIKLDNFKVFEMVEIDFSRINILIGPNGTGKSSIWQALILLRQSIEHEALHTEGPLINFGEFRNIANKKAEQKEIGMLISCDVDTTYPQLNIPKPTVMSYRASFDPKVMDYEAEITIDQERRYFVEAFKRQTNVIEPASIEIPAERPEGHPPEVSISLGVNYQIAKPFIIRSTKGTESVRKPVEDEIVALSSTINVLLRNTYYIPALRGLELPYYPLQDSFIMDVVPGDNKQLASTFAYSGRELEEVISEWCREITGSGIGAEVIPGKRVKIDSDVTYGGIPVVCDGFGTNQLVHLLLTLAITPDQAVIAIEEPEIHLHPKAQEKLCDIILGVSKDDKKQMIITTHSEHILYSFIQAVKKGKLSRDELAIYYFAEKGEEPQLVEQDETGDIYGWGRRFFGYPS